MCRLQRADGVARQAEQATASGEKKGKQGHLPDGAPLSAIGGDGEREARCGLMLGCASWAGSGPRG